MLASIFSYLANRLELVEKGIFTGMGVFVGWSIMQFVFAWVSK